MLLALEIACSVPRRISIVPLARDGLRLGQLGIVDRRLERGKEDVDDDPRLDAGTRKTIELLAEIALIGDQSTQKLSHGRVGCAAARMLGGSLDLVVHRGRRH